MAENTMKASLRHAATALIVAAAPAFALAGQDQAPREPSAKVTLTGMEQTSRDQNPTGDQKGRCRAPAGKGDGAQSGGEAKGAGDRARDRDEEC
jgi:hypothetical protein